MAYYAPPGGSFTAKVARQLQESGMSFFGILPSVNVRAVHAMVPAIGLARRRAAELAVQEAGSRTMTGMGIITKQPPGHASRYATPAPIVFTAAGTAARIAAQRGMQLMGLGAGARPRPMAAPAMPTTAGIRRQAAMFMAPGGGYSQIPGFMPAIGPPLKRLAGLGQEDTTMIPAPDVLTPPPVETSQPLFLIPTPSTPPQPTQYSAPTQLVSPSTPLAVQNSPLPKLAPGQMYVAQPGVTVTETLPFMSSAPLGVPNKYLIAAAAGIVVLTLVARKRRGNPRRRARRA